MDNCAATHKFSMHSNWINMPYAVDITVICVIMLLAISYLYKVIIEFVKQYILIHNSIIENNGVF